MSTSAKQREISDDEFESADEGETTSTSKSTAVTDGWDDWGTTDETTNSSRPKLTQQESLSSMSSSSLSKTEGTSQLGSDEDESTDSYDQHILQRKKLRKKSQEIHLNKDETKTNTRVSRPVERHGEDSINSTKKHHVNETHHLLDRLAAQSPTRTVKRFEQRRSTFLFYFSRIGRRRGVISVHFYRQQNKAFQH